MHNQWNHIASYSGFRKDLMNSIASGVSLAQSDSADSSRYAQKREYLAESRYCY